MAVRNLRKRRHSAYDIHYHFVYSVKYRRAVLEPDVVAELVRISQEIQQRYRKSSSVTGNPAALQEIQQRYRKSSSVTGNPAALRDRD